MVSPVIPVILSGGRGTRLWPLSRSSRPKQLQPLLGEATLLQATATRLDGVPGVTAPIVVCAASHVDPATEQLRAVGREPLVTIAEPEGRNTAPAIAAAALVAPPEAVLVVLPADHIVADLAAFRAAVSTAITAAAAGNLVAFGVVPTRPETGYGYIAVGESEGAARTIVSFVEKPDAATAEEFVSGGRHFWNAGMFVARSDVVIDQMRRHAPGVVDAVRRSLDGGTGPVINPGPAFVSALPLPFDVAVMERTRHAVMVPLDAGWDDVGSWRSLWSASDRDAADNAVVGDVVVHDTTRSYLRAHDRPIVALGLDEVVVVDAGDAVFVAPIERAQDVRDLVSRLDTERPELT